MNAHIFGVLFIMCIYYSLRAIVHNRFSLIIFTDWLFERGHILYIRSTPILQLFLYISQVEFQVKQN